jgi:uncharacterized protein (DUF4213/DUF364 family)
LYTAETAKPVAFAFSTGVTGCALHWLAMLLGSVDVNETVPLGATAPGLPETTWAVKVTIWLTTEVGNVEDRLNVVGVAPTVKLAELTVDPLKLISPEYVAMIV